MTDKSREVIGWFTTHGKHIPIMKGETKDQAIKRAFGGHAPKTMNSKKSSDSDSKNLDSNKSKEKTIKKVNIKKSDVDKVKSNSKSTQISSAKAKADALNEEQRYQSSLRAGNKVGIQNGRLIFKGKEVKPLNVADAHDDDSLGEHLDKDGNLTPERLKVHQKIIEKYFGGHKPYAPGQEKKCLFTGGGGASGKGQFGKRVGDFYSSDDNPVIIDADEIKKMLAKADGKKLDMDTTPYYHEESSALAKQIFGMALDNDFPVMFDGTATGVNSALKKIEQAKAAGYKTEMNFLYSDFNTVFFNSVKRYDTQDRLVPLGEQLRAHRQAFAAVQELNDKFDSFTLWDNRRIKESKKKGEYGMKKVATNTLGGKLKFEEGGKESWDFFSHAEEEFADTPERELQFWGAIVSVNAQKGKDLGTDRIMKEFQKDVEKRKKKNSGSGGK